MKKSYYVEGKHIGNQPIRVLFDLVGNFFVNMSDSFSDELKNAIDYQGFNSTIKLDKDGIHAEITRREKQVHISETFLSYLWCMCYCLFVFLKYFHPLNQINDESIDENLKKERKDNCVKLFKYALLLSKKGYTEWDIQNLPNPEFYSDIEETEIEAVNMIYIIATNFVFVHEFAHFQLGHLEMEEGEMEDEISADNYAFQTIIEYDYSEIDNSILKYGCIAALCALIFMDDDLIDKDRKYPDGDDRIRILVEKYASNEDDILWQLSTMALLLWAFVNQIKLNVTSHKNHKDLFHIVAEQLK